jgi:plastocyanin
MQFFTGPGTQAFTVDPLPAAEYEFFCSIHPTMTGTLTVE